MRSEAIEGVRKRAAFAAHDFQVAEAQVTVIQAAGWYSPPSVDEYGVNGNLIVIYPKPYSIYLRGTINLRSVRMRSHSPGGRRSFSLAFGVREAFARQSGLAFERQAFETVQKALSNLACQAFLMV